MLRAVELLKAIMKIDLSNIRRYEIDLERGILKADGEDDHRRALEALQAIKSTPDPQAWGVFGNGTYGVCYAVWASPTTTAR